MSSSPASGIRMVDIDGDGFLEIVFATFDGYVVAYLLSGISS